MSAKTYCWTRPDDPEPLFSSEPPPAASDGSTRVWVDGCFDLMHFGHFNILRQARSLGHVVFAGIHSSAEIEHHKGAAPVYNDKERAILARGCRWVDYVLENAPYVTRLRHMQQLNIDVVVHGDDVSFDADGDNSYKEILSMGKMRIARRTLGISTTDIIDRILFSVPSLDQDEEGSEPYRAAKKIAKCKSQYPVLQETVDNKSTVCAPEPETGLCTIRESLPYVLFSEQVIQWSGVHSSCFPTCQKVIYIHGVFDLFHAGHVSFLNVARGYGNYLVIGLVEKDGEIPIPCLNLTERSLALMSCRYVDYVIQDVPDEIPLSFINYLRASGVDVAVDIRKIFSTRNNNLFKNYGLYRNIGCDDVVDRENILNRVRSNNATYLTRNERRRP